MSAIYGVIDLAKEQVKDYSDSFLAEYKKCKIDKYTYISTGNVFMGCGLQYFTDEAHNECLPIADKENDLYFTSDCLLDNREELIKELELSQSDENWKRLFAECEASSLADGSLIYLAFLKWGEECVDHLRGIYSFVVYDGKKNEVVLVADHFSNRSLFYFVDKNKLYFSTLIFPLVNVSGGDFELNERWLIDSVSVRGPMLVTECEETAYKDIYKVSCGRYVKVTLEDESQTAKCDSYEYFNPVSEIKVNKKMDDNTARAEVRRVFEKAVNDCLRTNGEVAIQLSSGLDSASVAGFAAPVLWQKGKKLFSYTSIPLKGAVEDKGYYVADETEGVKIICERYDNICPEFVDCLGKSILSEAKELIDLWELPCQSQQNAVWINEIDKLASEKGCKVLLSGGTGNNTISSGNIYNYFFYLLSKGKFIKAYKAFNHYFDKYGAVKKGFIKRFLKMAYKSRIKKALGRDENYYEFIATRKDIGEKYNLNYRFNHSFIGGELVSSFDDVRNVMYMRPQYSQIGEIETKQSLRYGVLKRDPTKNVELIKLLLSFPMDKFVNQDYDRRLVREFFDGIVPDELRLDVKHRGRQSADNMYRIRQDLDLYKDDICRLLVSEATLHYLDNKKVDSLIAKLKDGTIFDDEADVYLLMETYIFALYLERLTNNV